MVIDLPSTTTDVGVQLSKQFASETEESRRMLLKIISCVTYLARQGLAYRGDGDESDGNFIQLLKLHDSSATHWLQRKCNKYTSHEIQNEIIRILALHVQKVVAMSVQSSQFLTVMIDETTDVTNREQVVLRRITETFQVFEEFLGLYHVDSITAECLSKVIFDSLLRYNISLNKLRGQCYDGCSTMSGARTGVAKRIAEKEPRALFTHCYVIKSCC